MAELPCPCWRPGARRVWARGFGVDADKRVLFLLTPLGQISGAVVQGKVLDQRQASALWDAWPWVPASPHQPMPHTSPGQQAADQPRPRPQW